MPTSVRNRARRSPRGRIAGLLTAALVGSGLALVAAAPAFAADPATTADGSGLPCLIPLLGDCTAPESVLNGTPPLDDARMTPNRIANFGFTTTVVQTGATFQCKLEGPAAAHDWVDCSITPPAGATTSNGSRSYSGLALGSYTFSVRATDNVGNVEATPETFLWTVANVPPPPDTQSPNTRIIKGPGFWTKFTFTSVTFRADEPTHHFDCRHNTRVVKCSGGQADLMFLPSGTHRFSVAAVDREGNTDLTPAVVDFTIPLNNTQLRHYGHKWTKHNAHGYFQDSYSLATKQGAYLTRSVVGARRLALVVTKGPTSGKVQVLFKGKSLGKFDLKAGRTKHRQIIELKTFGRARKGLVKIVVLSKDKPVYIEGLGVATVG